MEFSEVVRRRRMVRRYADRPVDPALVDRMLEHATRAPSAGFSQGWAFLRLDTPVDVARFWEVTTPEHADPESRWLSGMRSAPVVIVPLTSKDAYLDRYPRVRELIDEIVREARRTGKVRTLFGRQRYVPEIGSRNRATRSAAERVAVNTPIQGTAADLIKKAMIDLHRRLTEEKLETRLLLQVHDELVLESPDPEVAKASEVVRETMENVYPLEVPLRVDLKVGASWEH